jgi:hypothetical protein
MKKSGSCCVAPVAKAHAERSGGQGHISLRLVGRRRPLTPPHYPSQIDGIYTVDKYAPDDGCLAAFAYLYHISYGFKMAFSSTAWLVGSYRFAGLRLGRVFDAGLGAKHRRAPGQNDRGAELRALPALRQRGLIAAR